MTLSVSISVVDYLSDRMIEAITRGHECGLEGFTGMPMINPTDDERAAFNKAFGIGLATRREALRAEQKVERIAARRRSRMNRPTPAMPGA